MIQAGKAIGEIIVTSDLNHGSAQNDPVSFRTHSIYRKKEFSKIRQNRERISNHKGSILISFE